MGSTDRGEASQLLQRESTLAGPPPASLSLSTLHKHTPEAMAQVVVQTDPRKLFLHADLSIEPFLKSQLALRLDADRQLCPDHVVAHQPCPRGASCPYRHVQPSPLNFQPKQPVPQSAHARTVCKHWLRGLCKKGPQCEFMHEYHLRKMPECWFFAKYGFCSNGDEVSPRTFFSLSSARCAC